MYFAFLCVKLSVWRLGVGVDGGGPLWLVERVRALVLLTHSVNDEHDAKDGAQEADNGPSYDGWKRETQINGE